MKNFFLIFCLIASFAFGQTAPPAGGGSTPITIGPKITMRGGLISPVVFDTTIDSNYLYINVKLRVQDDIYSNGKVTCGGSYCESTQSGAATTAFYASGAISGAFQAAKSVRLLGGDGDAVNAVAIISDSTTNYVTGGALIHSFRNNAVQKAYVDYQGTGRFLQLWVDTNQGVYLNTGGTHRIFDDGTNVTTNAPFVQLAVGSTTGTIQFEGTLSINSTAVGNAADTTEDVLMTYTVPANSMSANNKMIRVTAWGSGVSTADVTTVKCYFGHATVLASGTNVVTRVLTASQANTWRVVYEVIRTGAATQIASATLVNGGTATTSVQSNSSPIGTTSGAMILGCTGQRATTSSANSVQQLGQIVEFFQ